MQPFANIDGEKIKAFDSIIDSILKDETKLNKAKKIQPEFKIYVANKYLLIKNDKEQFDKYKELINNQTIDKKFKKALIKFYGNQLNKNIWSDRLKRTLGELIEVLSSIDKDYNSIKEFNWTKYTSRYLSIPGFQAKLFVRIMNVLEPITQKHISVSIKDTFVINAFYSNYFEMYFKPFFETFEFINVENNLESEDQGSIDEKFKRICEKNGGQIDQKLIDQIFDSVYEENEDKMCNQLASLIFRIDGTKINYVAKMKDNDKFILVAVKFIKANKGYNYKLFNESKEAFEKRTTVPTSDNFSGVNIPASDNFSGVNISDSDFFTGEWIS